MQYAGVRLVKELVSGRDFWVKVLGPVIKSTK